MSIGLTVPAAAAAPRLVGAYRPGSAVFDEMLGADGRIKPHWQAFIAQIEALGPERLHDMLLTTQRLLGDTGIAFNINADPDDRKLAWRLDLLPVLIDPADWHALERGLIQRARMIEAVLQDLHGPRRLLFDRLLPPALIFGSPDYLRACVNWADPPKRFASVLAFDIARDAQGRWRVLADHVDTPAGNGWVLASRVALSQAMGELFLATNPRRLASHYAALQDHLRTLSREDGLIVVLSTAPNDPSYFSQAYLARYLGYPLVEAADLTVRDSRVFLKTLEGLIRVDVVLRKLPGRGLDPLYVAGGDGLGVAGLLGAAIQGNVTLANALGTGVVQHRTLAGAAPRLIQQLLAEEPLLDDAEALWLGDAEAQTRLIDGEPEHLVTELNARFNPGDRHPTMSDRITTMPRDALRAFLAREGHRYVALGATELATTPAFTDGALTPVRYAFRAFVIATEDGFRVLPGGLGRLSPSAATHVLPNGYGSKDLWLPSEGGEPPAGSILSAHLSDVHLRRTGRDLLSRSADHLFWLGRYTERAETIMRLLRAVLSRLLIDAPADRNPELLARLLKFCLLKDDPDQDEVNVEATVAGIERAVRELLFEPNHIYGLRQTLDLAQRNAVAARAHLPHDGWRVLNAIRVDRRWRQSVDSLVGWPPFELLDSGLRCLTAFTGVVAENMTRNYAWRFLELGRRIERGQQTAEMLRALIDDREETHPAMLKALLELCDSFITYRSRYVMVPMVTPTIDLLVLDETNPRALAYQLQALEAMLDSLPREGPYRTAEHRRTLAMLTEWRLYDADTLSRRAPAHGEADSESSAPLPLHPLLEGTLNGLQEVSDLLGRKYFAHAEPAVSTLPRGAQTMVG